MHKITVIVPVYNVEKYLDKCIESIVNQTYKNLEIILVDDGSPDGSPAICDKWAERDSRIKVIHKENGGVSAARNAGLDCASGDYIGFVDSDDCISDADMYYELADMLVRENVQLSVCGYTRNETAFASSKTEIFEKDKVSAVLFDIDNFPYFEGFTWNKLYDAKIIRENNIRFKESLRMCEDTLFNFDYLKHIDKCAAINKCMYSYTVRDNSVMSVKPVKCDLDMLDLIDYFIETSPNNMITDCIVKWAFKYWIRIIDDCFILNIKKDYQRRAEQLIKKYRKKIFQNNKSTATDKIFTFCICYCKPVYYLYKKLKSRAVKGYIREYEQ